MKVKKCKMLQAYNLPRNMYCVICILLRTFFTVLCTVQHAFILGHEYVDVSATITVAGAIATAFEVCVVVPGSISLVCARPAQCIWFTDPLYKRTHCIHGFTAASCQILGLKELQRQTREIWKPKAVELPRRLSRSRQCLRSILDISRLDYNFYDDEMALSEQTAFYDTVSLGVLLNTYTLRNFSQPDQLAWICNGSQKVT